MLKLKDFDKVLVSYLYEPSKLKAVVNHTPAGPVAELVTVPGNKKGVVVALGPGILGWSLCDSRASFTKNLEFRKGDVFNREVGLGLALKRAKIAESLEPHSRESLYAKVPHSLTDLFEEMEFRAEKYFSNTPTQSSEEIASEACL